MRERIHKQIANTVTMVVIIVIDFILSSLKQLSTNKPTNGDASIDNNISVLNFSVPFETSSASRSIYGISFISFTLLCAICTSIDYTV